MKLNLSYLNIQRLWVQWILTCWLRDIGDWCLAMLGLSLIASFIIVFVAGVISGIVIISSLWLVEQVYLFIFAPCIGIKNYSGLTIVRICMTVWVGMSILFNRQQILAEDKNGIYQLLCILGMCIAGTHLVEGLVRRYLTQPGDYSCGR